MVHAYVIYSLTIVLISNSYTPPSHRATLYQNHKGFLSQNCLFICGFDLDFKYTLCGWEGSASDVWVYEEVLTCGLVIPEGKYILDDLGYSYRGKLLVPY